MTEGRGDEHVERIERRAVRGFAAVRLVGVERLGIATFDSSMIELLWDERL